MNALINNFKKYLILLFLTILAIFLLWLKFFVSPQIPQKLFLITPSPLPSPPTILLSSPIPPPSNPSLLSDISPNLVYQGDLFNPPDKLPVYSPSEPKEITFEQAKQYAEIFGFSNEPTLSKKDPQNPPFFLWQQEGKVFSFGGSPPVIHFFNENMLKQPPQTFLNENNYPFLLKRTQQELERLNIKNVDFQSPRFFFFTLTPSSQNPTSFELLETKSSENTSLLGIGLTYNLNGFEIITNTPRNLPLLLVFDPEGNLFELTAYLFTPKPQVSLIKNIPFEQAVKSLNKQGIIFNIYSEEELNKKEISLYNLKEVNLDSVKIVYYLPTSFSQNIFPYYLLTGKSQDQKSKKTLDVTVLLPINPEP